MWKFQRGCSQKIGTRILPGLRGISCKARLDKLGLISLNCWRLRRDLIEVYKCMRGIDRVDSLNLFPQCGKTKEHRFKVRGGKFKEHARIRFFTQRVKRTSRSGG